jgi:predicted transcriptional regulator
MAAPAEIVAARDLLDRYDRHYDLPRDTPVPVDDIAESLLGLLVRIDSLEPGVSGMLLVREREIRVSAEECARWPARRPFTVAHEIGHWELHAADIDAPFICRRADIEEAGESDAAAIRRREREANNFAAELLMPEPRVRSKAAEPGRDEESLAAHFGVSGLAMGWRLYNLGLRNARPDPAAFDAPAAT